MIESSRQRVCLAYGDSEFVLRQTPGRAGRWGEFAFDSGDSAERGGPTTYAGAIVYERLARPLQLTCDRVRTLFVTGEPESIRTYHPAFLGQFGAVLTSRGDLRHPHVIRSQPAIPWWAGVRCAYPHKTEARLGYDDFVSAAPSLTSKPKLMSIVCSTKAMTEGHRKRLVLVERLREHFGTRLEVYGHGFNEVADKWDAIASYRYHLAIENSSFPHYWTEKIADAFLGNAFPIYWGCPNLSEYFPERSYERIERDDASAAIETIERVLAEDVAVTRESEVREARRRLLDEHNLFPTAVRILRSLGRGTPRRITLRPESDFTDPAYRVVGRRVKRHLKGLLGG